MNMNADTVIVGAGIVGLSIARELKQRYPEQKIVVFEKEDTLGRHGSGRNSGVLHSGIYYPEGSFKAKVCAEGGRALAAYCEAHGLPIKRIGKVILPLQADDDQQLALLARRARSNGAQVELVDEQQLKQIEPEAHSPTGQALYSPHTAVIDPLAVLHHLADELRAQGVEIHHRHQISVIDPGQASLKANGTTVGYGYLYNTAGLYADVVARAFGVGARYTILPFKGLYYRLSETSGININGLIYPVPDLRVPFLGVHFTKQIGGKVHLGPTAIPAFGRENYAGLKGLNVQDTGSIMYRLLQQYMVNKQGFRTLVHEEGMRFLKRYFARAAQSLVPRLKPEHLLTSDKVGIRAQLLDTQKQELVMDFVVEHGDRSTHILNAVSPAFTSAFSFARVVVDQAQEVSGSYQPAL
jgi:(S)-2-hydroxyglutarate dehydrogenase